MSPIVASLSLGTGWEKHEEKAPKTAKATRNSNTRTFSNSSPTNYCIAKATSIRTTIRSVLHLYASFNDDIGLLWILS